MFYCTQKLHNALPYDIYRFTRTQSRHFCRPCHPSARAASPWILLSKGGSRDHWDFFAFKMFFNTKLDVRINSCLLLKKIRVYCLFMTSYREWPTHCAADCVTFPSDLLIIWGVLCCGMGPAVADVLVVVLPRLCDSNGFKHAMHWATVHPKQKPQHKKLWSTMNSMNGPLFRISIACCFFIGR